MNCEDICLYLIFIDAICQCIMLQQTDRYPLCLYNLSHRSFMCSYPSLFPGVSLLNVNRLMNDSIPVLSVVLQVGTKVQYYFFYPIRCSQHCFIPVYWFSESR